MRVSEDGVHIIQKKNVGQYNGPDEQFNNITCAISSVFTCCLYKNTYNNTLFAGANYIN